MLKVDEINSMKQIRDIIDEIIRNMTYSSNNKVCRLPGVYLSM